MIPDVSAAREPLFTERETAERLRISVPFLKTLRYGKKISCYRFGDRVFYTDAHIEEFKQQNEKRVAPIAA